jgi:hypothetical protein
MFLSKCKIVSSIALIVVSAYWTEIEAQTLDAVSHRFIAFGNSTYIVEANGEVSWTYSRSTRDGYVLEDGTMILTLSKSKEFPGGAVVRIGLDGSEDLIWKGSQSEVNSAHPTDEGTIVLTEAGEKPRLIEIDLTGKERLEFSLRCQTENTHLQTRMARKLSDGTYLVPHLLDFAVLQYSKKGEEMMRLDTTVPGDVEHKIHTWPFTAIRHGDDETLVCCTHGNQVVNFSDQGMINWRLTNDDLPGPWLQDPCGGQVLPNGNIVIACYAAGRVDPSTPKLFEITRDKQIVWTYVDGKKLGVHHFQILDTNGQKFQSPILK